MIRLALLFSLVLVAYDAMAASIARSITVSYNSFVVLSLVLIFFMGIYAGRVKGCLGILSIVIAAAIETTAGWYVAAVIGPGYVPGWTIRGLVAMAVQSALLSIAIGAAGVWIGLRVRGARRSLF